MAITRKQWIKQGNDPHEWTEAPIDQAVLEAMQAFDISLPMVAAIEQLAERTVLHNNGFPPKKTYEDINGNVTSGLMRRHMVYKLDEGKRWSPLLLTEKGKEVATQLGYMAAAEKALAEHIALENWRDYAIDNRQRVENFIRDLLPKVGCQITLQARSYSWLLDVAVSTLAFPRMLHLQGAEYRVEKTTYQSGKADHYRVVVRHAPIIDPVDAEYLQRDVDLMLQIATRLNLEMQANEPGGAYNGEPPR